MRPKYVRIEADPGHHGKTVRLFDEQGNKLTSVRSIGYQAAVDGIPTVHLEFLLPEMKVEGNVRSFSFECPCGHQCHWQREVPDGEFVNDLAADGVRASSDPDNAQGC